MTSPGRSFFLALTLTAAMMLFAAVARSQDASNDAAQDLTALQGSWERTITRDDPTGHGAARAVKEISGKTEKVTYTSEAGDDVYATVAEFRLEPAGRVRLYTYWNLKVTRGKDAGGEPPSGEVSYIYRLDGDACHEAHGMLVDSPAGSKARVVTWKRVK